MTSEQFQAVVPSLNPMLLNVARRYLASDGEAEDVVQDVLLKLWQMHDALRIPVYQLATVLVRNHAIDRLRRRKPVVALSEGLSEAAESTSSDRLERMMQVVETLPDMQQTILRLRHMEGMEFKAIAKLFDMSEQAVRQALSRARKEVRNRYQKGNDS